MYVWNVARPFLRTVVSTYIKMVHEVRKDYVCNFCNKAFSMKQSFEEHIKAVHVSPKPKSEKMIHDILETLKVDV